MAEFDSKGRRLISVVRILEYHGTEEWVTKVFQACRVPIQGEFKGHPDATGRVQPLAEGCWIRSGLVVWNVEGEAQQPIETIPVPPGSIQ